MGVRAVVARRVGLLVGAGALAVGAAVADPPAPENRLEASAPALDLGEAAPGATVEGMITLRNAGRRAVGIVEASTSCSCTVAAIEPRVADPGGSIAVTVALDAPKFAGEERSAEVRILTTEGETIAIPVRVRTPAALAAEATGLLTLPDGALAVALAVRSLDGEAFELTGLPAEIARTLAPGAEHRFTLPLRADSEGRLPTTVRISTTRGEQPEVVVPLGALLLDEGYSEGMVRRAAARARPGQLDLDLEPGAVEFVAVELDPWPDAAVRLSWTNPSFAFELVSIEPRGRGAVATLAVTNEGRALRSRDRLTITSPSYETSLHIIARIEGGAR